MVKERKPFHDCELKSEFGETSTASSTGRDPRQKKLIEIELEYLRRFVKLQCTYTDHLLDYCKNKSNKPDTVITID